MLDCAFRRSSASLIRTAVPEQERTALEQPGFTRAICRSCISQHWRQRALCWHKALRQELKLRPHEISAYSFARSTGYRAAVFPSKTKYFRQDEKGCEVPVSKHNGLQLYLHMVLGPSQGALLVADVYFQNKT